LQASSRHHDMIDILRHYFCMLKSPWYQFNGIEETYFGSVPIFSHQTPITGQSTV
jgi:hypothetical protein